MAALLFVVLFTLGSSAQRVLPTKQQVAWANAEVGVIIHLDINIYAPATFDYKDRSTLPDVNIFNPSRLNTDQWVRTAKAAGARYALLTVKHGTGFCLWPSKVNNYNVGHTKWRNGQADILKNFITSCKKYGIKPGLYYNTNTNTYLGTDNGKFVSGITHAGYNKAVLAQLTELWTTYGKMFEIWFDGGINNDKKYGLETSIMKLIEANQPQAILFQGPVSSKNIIRWIGNEDGIAAYPQWSRANATTASNGLVKIDGLHGDPEGKLWCPGESDFPIRRNNAWNGGWLWKASEESYLFNVNDLTEKYYKSVGRNTNMLIGMVVDTSGLIPKADSLVFDSLGRHLNQLFGRPVAVMKNSYQKSSTLNVSVAKPISKIVLQEDIAKGENIRGFLVEARIDNQWIKISEGESVGHKYIQTFKPIITNKIRVIVKKSTGNIALKSIAVYL